MCATKRSALVVLCLAACGKDSARGNEAEKKAEPSEEQRPFCQSMDYPLSLELAEASGSAFLPGHPDQILVTSDSGHRGAFVIIDAKTGEKHSSGELPLDSGASDDIEGLAMRNGEIVAITSSGWLRHYRVEDEGFALSEPSYGLADHAPESSRETIRKTWQCRAGTQFNCGPVFEGLCLAKGELAEQDDPSCIGFAASKAHGTLLCLRQAESGHYYADPSATIGLDAKKTLSGCSINEQGELWIGANGFAANRVALVENWQAVAEARVKKSGNAGSGFGESLLAGPDGELYRFSDTGSKPSLLSKYRCR